MKVFGYCAEIIRSNGLKLTRCHGHYLHQDFRGLLYCMEKAKGQAKITPAFNLPCDHVIHTVGPIVQGKLTKEHEQLLISCYESCLRIADENEVKSIAFCCISTGVFMFPNKRAAELAVQTVKQYKEKTKSKIKVIFNVFKEEDERLYNQLLR